MKKIIICKPIFYFLIISTILNFFWGTTLIAGQDNFLENIISTFKTDFDLNEKYFHKMQNALTIEEKYKIFYEYRMAYLKADLLFEIQDMKNPLPGLPANQFPSIITYITEDQKHELSPFDKRLYEDYQKELKQYIK